MEKIISVEHFFSEDDLAVLEQAIKEGEPGRDQIYDYGPFAGKLIANYIPMINNQTAKELINKKLADVLDRPFTVNSLARTRLYFPWDIHADFFLDQCKDGNVPYYCFLIPLDAVPSRTIIFNEFVNESNNYSNAFADYKNTHDKTNNPIDKEFWEENLSMCWPQDREYASLKAVMPYQQRGQLHGWPCKYFHSSDNFHTRMSTYKDFITIRTGTTNDF